MTDTHAMKLEIDASGAKGGADTFVGAINRIAASLQKVDQLGTQTFKNLQTALGGLQTSHVTNNIGNISKALSTLKVDPALSGHLKSLSQTLSSFHGVPANAAAQLSAFSTALGSLRTPNIDVTRVQALANALKGFRAPSVQQTQNLTGFFNALHTMNVPATTKIDDIVNALHRVSAAANQARAALNGVSNANVNIPPGLRNFGRGGGGGGGGRGGHGMAPWDGIFSGTHRATAEMRGMENIVNPSFQAASVMRTMVSGVTIGESLKSLMEEGEKMTQFQHSLEVSTTVPDNAIESHKRLAQAMQFTVEVADKYGIKLNDIQEVFPRFAISAQAAGFSLKTTETMFANVSVGMRSLGASTQEIIRVYRAFDQMMQTGHVSMMQLHKEIGLIMPATQLMAETLSRVEHKKVRPQDVEERTKKGTLGSNILPEFAATIEQHYKSGLETAVNSPVAALNRLENQWKLTKQEMLKEGLFDEMGKQFNRFADMLKRDDIQDFFKRVADGLAKALRGIGDMVEWASHHVNELTIAFKAFLAVGTFETVMRIGLAFGNTASIVMTLASGLATATSAMLGFGAAVGVLEVLLSPMVLLVGGILAVGAALYFGSDALLTFGKTSGTVGEAATGMWYTIRDAAVTTFNWIKSGADTLVNTITGGTGGVLEGISTMVNGFANAIMNTIAIVVAGVQNVWTLIKQVSSAANALAHADLAGAKDSFSSKDYVGPDQVMDDFVKKFQAEKAKQDAAAAAHAADLASKKPKSAAEQMAALMPETDHPTIAEPKPKKPKHHAKTQFEKDEDHFQKILDEVSPMDKVLHQYSEGMRLATEMEKSHKFSSEQLARAKMFLVEKLKDGLKFIDPTIKANHELWKAEQTMEGLVRIGAMTVDQKTRAMAAYREELKKQLDPYGSYLELMEKEIKLAGMGPRERAGQAAVDKINETLKSKGMPELTKDQANTVRGKANLLEDTKQAEKNDQVGLQQWANTFQDVGTELNKLTEKIADDLPKAFVNFIETGKTGWKDLVRTILEDMAMIFARQAERSVFQALGLVSDKPGADPHGGGLGDLFNAGAGFLGSIFGGGSNGQPNAGEYGPPAPGSANNSMGGGLTSILSSLFSSGAGAADGAGAGAGGAAASAGGFFSMIASLFAADGLTNTSSASTVRRSGVGMEHWANAPHYAEGTPNTSGGIPSILHPNEAVIPLSRGRSIPVDLGNSGGQQPVNVTMHVHTNDADSFRAAESQINSRIGAAIQRSVFRNGAWS